MSSRMSHALAFDDLAQDPLHPADTVEMDDKIDRSGHANVRIPVDHIENIRSIPDLSYADLASLFDVSQQTIYRWFMKESDPEVEKHGMIIKLSHIVTLFKNSGIIQAGGLMKIKTFAGQSLLSLLKSGHEFSKEVDFLVNMEREMELSYKNSGLSSSKAKPTNDWQSYISIPGSLETN
ncbi:MAG: transposase family protein [Magnetococcus sp. DMHC-1]|nr:hypothetical protein [Magnetococcales bacterium]